MINFQNEGLPDIIYRRKTKMVIIQQNLRYLYFQMKFKITFM